MSACDDCLRRTALVARLAPHVERARRERRRLRELLALPDDALIAALAGDRRGEIAHGHERFDAACARERAGAAAIDAVCRHDERYPLRLLEAADAPAILHVAGDAELLARLAAPEVPAVAIVGARRAGAAGLHVAHALGRGLAAAGVSVISGMALGIDSAAHAGALVIRHAQDALDEALGIGVATALTGRRPDELEPELRGLLRSVEDGRDTVSALAATPAEAQHALAGLSELELLGFVRRGPGGRYVRLL